MRMEVANPLKETGLEVDLHRPFVDRVVFEKNGLTYRRIHEVADAWFDSGAMFFAQMHYPFENVELFEKSFPSDFIAEGIDQTRGWFYTLHNIAVALFDKPAYKNIVVNELILDKHGIKMSKSKGNGIDPYEVMEKYGADAVRWYLFVNNPPWKATLFNEEDIVRTVLSDFFRSLTNTYAFFALYANIDKFDSSDELIPVSERPEIDRWIISRTNTVLGEFRRLMNEYELFKASRSVQNFVIYELSNWYIRRNRRRFWKGEKDKEKIAAYQTLLEVLRTVISMIAPTCPFLSEDLYSRLKNANDPESIHFTSMPEPNKDYIDEALERKMAIAQTIVSLARTLREKSKIRTRQPLRRILVPVLTPDQRRDIQYFEDIIIEEINVRQIEFVTGEADIVSRSAKPNFKTIGKKFGKITQKVAGAIKLLTNADIIQLEKANSFEIDIEGEKIILTRDDIEIQSEDIEGWLVESDGGVTVALDTQLDDELLTEGLAREFVNRIQNLRKQSNFEVMDRITIEVSASEKYKKMIEAKKDYIMNETLAGDIEFKKDVTCGEISIDDDTLFVNLIKKS